MDTSKTSIPQEFSAWLKRWSNGEKPSDPSEDKESLRQEIQKQTEEYLARGGEITQVQVEDGFYYNHPPKLSRRQQVHFGKKFLKITYNSKTD